MEKFIAFLKEWGLTISIIILILLSRIYIWNPVTVDGHSMDPTLADKERLIMVATTKIERFDIVVATELNETGKEIKIVKRVIGMPGDTIKYENDILYVNGQQTDEPYLDEYLAAFAKDKLQNTYSYNNYFQELAANANAFTIDATGGSSFEVIVPDGQYYLLGDDRIVSKDSRTVGTFDEATIIGEVKLRMWPLNKLSLF